MKSEWITDRLQTKSGTYLATILNEYDGKRIVEEVYYNKLLKEWEEEPVIAWMEYKKIRPYKGKPILVGNT